MAEECLAAAEDDDGRWLALTGIGNIHKDTEHYPEAMDAHSAALDLALGKLPAKRAAQSWNNLGTLFINASAWDLALECLSRITEDQEYARAWPPYVAHTNLALCHLHLGQINAGLLSTAQAFRLETRDLIEENLTGPVALRLAFVQLSLHSDWSNRAEIFNRAAEATEFSQREPGPYMDAMGVLIEASLESAFGDREAGISSMAALLPRAPSKALPDVLFALVCAEKLAGRRDEALAHLREWERHLYPDGAARARALGLTSWLSLGETIHEHRREMLHFYVPPALRELLKAA